MNVSGGYAHDGGFMYNYDINFRNLSDDRNAYASKVLREYFGSNFIKSVFDTYHWTPEGVHTEGKFLLKEPLHRQKTK